MACDADEIGQRVAPRTHRLRTLEQGQEHFLGQIIDSHAIGYTTGDVGTDPVAMPHIARTYIDQRRLRGDHGITREAGPAPTLPIAGSRFAATLATEDVRPPPSASRARMR